MKICQKCGHNNLNSDKFCGQCGSKLIEPKPKNYCPKCKTTTQRNLKFCTECGTKLVVKPSYTKPKTSTPSKPQSQHKSSTHHNNYDNIRKISNESYIVNLRKNTNVKSKVNYDNSVYISEEPHPYSKLTDTELKEKLRYYNDKFEDYKKAGDPSFRNYYVEMKNIQKELDKRNPKQKLKPEPNKKDIKKNKTSSKPFKLNKNSVKKKKSDPKPKIIYKRDTSEKPRKKPFKKPSKNKTKWKTCTRCNHDVLTSIKICPYCKGSTFYNKDEMYEKETIKDNSIGKGIYHIEEEFDVEKEKRIKSKKLKNKLKFIY